MRGRKSCLKVPARAFGAAWQLASQRYRTAGDREASRDGECMLKTVASRAEDCEASVHHCLNNIEKSDYFKVVRAFGNGTNDHEPS